MSGLIAICSASLECSSKRESFQTFSSTFDNKMLKWLSLSELLCTNLYFSLVKYKDFIVVRCVPTNDVASNSSVVKLKQISLTSYINRICHVALFSKY